MNGRWYLGNLGENSRKILSPEIQGKFYLWKFMKNFIGENARKIVSLEIQDNFHLKFKKTFIFQEKSFRIASSPLFMKNCKINKKPFSEILQQISILFVSSVQYSRSSTKISCRPSSRIKSLCFASKFSQFFQSCCLITIV